MYRVSANKDRLEAEGLYDPQVWTQSYTSTGLVWKNKVVQDFVKLNPAKKEYNMLQMHRCYPLKNWLE